MNKYQEALSSIRFSLGMRAKPKYVYESEKENFDILEELVEKATPKDPPFYQDYDLKKEFGNVLPVEVFYVKMAKNVDIVDIVNIVDKGLVLRRNK